jgi:hypothetical protein
MALALLASCNGATDAAETTPGSAAGRVRAPSARAVELTADRAARAPNPADAGASPVAAASVWADPSRAPGCPAGWRCDTTLLASGQRPKVTTVLIEKAAHRLHLAVGDTVVKSYAVALGWGGAGPKQYEGDGRTPVGTYRITGRLPTSPWHLFLAVSYPNLEDQRRYGALKVKGGVPIGAGVGFGIGIHGRKADMRDGEHKQQDWTLGCIAHDNPEIEEVATLVPNGAAVVITD